MTCGFLIRGMAEGQHPQGQDVAPRRDDAEEEESLDCSNTCCAITFGVVAVLVGFLVWAVSGPVDPLDSQVQQFSNDQVLRTVVWPGRSGGGVRGANGRDTDWAVFFYKPYCGACKRVWPAFRALGATTNSSGRLRFGEVNCVRDRHVCSMLGAEKQPAVRIYRATVAAAPGGGGGGGKPSPGFKREVVAEWQGLLIAYELVDWFKSLQSGPDALLHESIAWPDAGELGAAMRRFKARGQTQTETSMSQRPKDPAGYLVDASLALEHGLTDHMFPKEGVPLEGDRLSALLSWLAMQAHTFPQAATRARLAKLQGRLEQRPKWERAAYEAAVRANGFSVTPPADGAWRWCTTAAGRGGYPCGLWLLFHATLANVERRGAADALHTIAVWVQEFFGCAECARHFVQYFQAHGGGQVEGGHIGAVLWLWRAHNDVTKRLRAEEERTDGQSSRLAGRWPPQADCEACHNASDVQSADHSTFEYLQEVFCFESDTYVCAGFDDPSKERGSRNQSKA